MLQLYFKQCPYWLFSSWILIVIWRYPHPLYHKTNITKQKLLSIFGMTQFIYTISHIFYIDELLYSVTVRVIIVMSLYTLLMCFIDYKLLKISRKHQSFNSIYPDKKKAISLKLGSLCLMAFASLLFFTIICLILLVYNIILPVTRKWDMFSLWFKRIMTLNSSFNSMIILWKNSILWAEAIKIIKAILNSFRAF